MVYLFTHSENVQCNYLYRIPFTHDVASVSNNLVDLKSFLIGSARNQVLMSKSQVDG